MIAYGTGDAIVTALFLASLKGKMVTFLVRAYPGCERTQVVLEKGAVKWVLFFVCPEAESRGVKRKQPDDEAEAAE